MDDTWVAAIVGFLLAAAGRELTAYLDRRRRRSGRRRTRLEDVEIPHR